MQSYSTRNGPATRTCDSYGIVVWGSLQTLARFLVVGIVTDKGGVITGSWADHGPLGARDSLALAVALLFLDPVAQVVEGLLARHSGTGKLVGR